MFVGTVQLTTEPTHPRHVERTWKQLNGVGVHVPTLYYSLNFLGLC